MDHSFHLLNSVQYSLLRHLRIMYSTDIAQNNVLSQWMAMKFGSLTSAPLNKSVCVPIPMTPHHNFRTSNKGSH